MRKILLLFLLAAWFQFNTLTQAALTNLVWVGACDTPGDAQSVQVIGATAYVADGSGGLQIIDVSNPRNPVRIGGYDTPGETYGLHVVGHTAYLADGINGLEILDVSDPAHVVRLGGYNTTGSLYAGVRVRGDLAYPADGNLKIFNVQNPANPALICNVDISAHMMDVRLLSNYAYFAAGRLIVYEVSNPTQPLWVTNLNVGGLSLCMDQAGQYLYVADQGTGLNILDVSDPAHPTLVGQHAVEGQAYHVAAAGDCAYVIHIIRVSFALSVFNVADPAHPALIMTYNIPGAIANCLQVRGDFVLVAAGPTGLGILQAQPPQRPELSIRRVGDDALITWPSSALGFSLVSKTDLNATAWSPVAQPPVFSNDVFGVSVPAVGTEFFRLLRLP